MFQRHTLDLSETHWTSIYLDPSDKRPTFYLETSYGADYSFADLQKIITTHWQGCDLSKISISSVMEKTRGCGCHPEPSDYETFLRIELIQD